MCSTDYSGEAGQFHFQTYTYKKNFLGHVYSDWHSIIHEVRYRQTGLSIIDPNIHRGLDDKRPSATVQTDPFQMVSKVLPQRHNYQCEVQPGGKKNNNNNNFDHIFCNNAILDACKHESLDFRACSSRFLCLLPFVCTMPLKYNLLSESKHSNILH